MERLTTNEEYIAGKNEYERHLKQGYPRNIGRERFLKLCELEQKQEKELLIELKAKPRDRVYVDYCGEITEATVISFSIENEKYMSGTYRLYIDPDTEKEVDADDVYLNYYEAIEALTQKEL